MRRRLVRSSLLTTSVAIVLFAAPLAFAVHLVLLRDADAVLERAALRVAGGLDPQDVPGTAARALRGARSLTDPGAQLSVYSPDGVLVAGSGPAMTQVVTPQDTWPRRFVADGVTVVELPVEERDRVMALVRAQEPASAVNTRTAQAVVGLAALGLLVLGLAAVFARREARRLAAPVQELTSATRALADGVFAVRVRPTGVTELDEAAQALAATGRRLGALIERETSFADDATHQLRTPLTGLRLAVESALAGSDDALRARLRTIADATDRLAVVVDDLQALRRPPPSGDEEPDDGSVLDGSAVAAMVRARWEEVFGRAGRRLDVVLPTAAATGTTATEAAVRQTLDTLLDNALGHGEGTVTVTVRDVHGALAVDVADEGRGVTLPVADLFRRGVTTAGGRGIGLALARSLVAAEGGRLELTSRTPTRFTVFLPGATAE